MSQWAAVQTYQSWFYRVGLVGLILVGAVVGVASARGSGSGSVVNTDSGSTTVTGAALSTPPGEDAPFSLSAPLNGSHWTIPVVSFAGVGPPGATVSVAGGPGVVITSAGTFAVPGLLTPGENQIVVTVTTVAGAQSSLTVTVVYDPVAPRTSFVPSTKPPSTATPGTKPPKSTTTTQGGGGGTTTTQGGGGGTTTTQPHNTTTTTTPEG